MATIPRRETCAVTTWGTGRGGQVQSGNREDKRTLLNAKVAAQFRVVWDREHCRKLTCQGGGEDLVKVACVDLSEDVVLNVSLTRRHAPPPARAEPLLEIETLSNSRQDYRAEIRADILDEERSVVPAAHLYIPQTHLVHGRKDILWTEWNAVLQRFQRGSHFHVVLAITLAPVDGSDLAAETIRKHEEIYSRRKSSSPKHAQPPPPRAPFGLQVLGGLVSEGMADSTIVCGQRSWPAHSFILKLRSPVFAKMLESNFRDRNAKCLDLTYWEKMPPASAVDAFVAFVNEDNRSGIEEHAMSLLSIAHMYEVDDLKRCCEDAIIQNLTTTWAPIACEVLHSGILFSMERLLNAATDYVLFHLAEYVFHLAEINARNDCGVVEHLRKEARRLNDPEANLVLFTK